MGTVAKRRPECKPHGFESVGPIINRLFKRKTDLEGRMPPKFDPSLSLDLDTVIVGIDAMEEANGGRR